ncbi:putative drug resistance efflux protein [Rhodococcus opacus B4]|uniref:Putative drug resistance efflux protein n=1 Tax=Rhodococcus opacus (strain B4) TaxID=632772 RepID=C1AR74_RHOOB|nr:putative drug resistance efflux protein [Rhodococcus opacus B4]
MICAIGPSMEVLLVGRAVQGLGGGLLAGLNYAVLREALPEHLWARATALVSAMWGVGTLAGPAIGGLFAQLGQWRLAFVALAVVAAAIAVIAPRALPRTGRVRGGRTRPGHVTRSAHPGDDRDQCGGDPRQPHPHADPDRSGSRLRRSVPGLGAAITAPGAAAVDVPPGVVPEVDLPHHRGPRVRNRVRGLHTAVRSTARRIGAVRRGVPRRHDVGRLVGDHDLQFRHLPTAGKDGGHAHRTARPRRRLAPHGGALARRRRTRRGDSVGRRAGRRRCGHRTRLPAPDGRRHAEHRRRAGGRQGGGRAQHGRVDRDGCRVRGRRCAGQSRRTLDPRLRETALPRSRRHRNGRRVHRVSRDPGARRSALGPRREVVRATENVVGTGELRRMPAVRDAATVRPQSLDRRLGPGDVVRVGCQRGVDHGYLLVRQGQLPGHPHLAGKPSVVPHALGAVRQRRPVDRGRDPGRPAGIDEPGPGVCQRHRGSSGAGVAAIVADPEREPRDGSGASDVVHGHDGLGRFDESNHRDTWDVGGRVPHLLGRFGFREHQPAQPGQAADRVEVALPVRGGCVVDPHPARIPFEPPRGATATVVLRGERQAVLEVDDQRIGAGGRRRGENLVPDRGDQKPASRHRDDDLAALRCHDAHAVLSSAIPRSLRVTAGRRTRRSGVRRTCPGTASSGAAPPRAVRLRSRSPRRPG